MSRGTAFAVLGLLTVFDVLALAINLAPPSPARTVGSSRRTRISPAR